MILRMPKRFPTVDPWTQEADGETPSGFFLFLNLSSALCCPIQLSLLGSPLVSCQVQARKEGADNHPAGQKVHRSPSLTSCCPPNLYETCPKSGVCSAPCRGRCSQSLSGLRRAGSCFPLGGDWPPYRLYVALRPHRGPPRRWDGSSRPPKLPFSARDTRFTK